ncbi:MAG: U32 family peptidase [Clostridium sp.]|nr:U32 family peptidase [Clostridium sp.]
MRDGKKTEILAPAGSMDALRAAVCAGADAVYLGGNRFGARAFADNFDEDALLDAIQYAHIYGVKVYLTVNTLFRDEEIESLHDYLLPLYEAGLDAVIVQDLGVVSYVHETFPDLPIHASTQMTVTTQYAFTVLKDYGVTRIIPARELSIEEIAGLKKTPVKEPGNPEEESIYAGTKDSVPEVEVFVQGALCYCYSGQCLMSSMLGGRSGNRGRCAQTCRLAFDAADARGNRLHTDGRYILSPKDLCGLESIPALIRAGVDSFKIEGRMKKPEYVAACVRSYRICLDAWFDGKLTKEMIHQQRQEMAEVFNRGGFTDGYYQRHNGKEMITVQNPGNVGVEIGKIQGMDRNRLAVKLSKEVFHGDILVIGSKEDPVTLTCNTDGEKGDEIVLNAPHSKILKRGMAVNRMQSAKLMSELSRYGSEEKKVLVSGKIILKAGETAQLSLAASVKGETYTVTVGGAQVQEAANNPLREEVIQKKITATGNTRYRFEKFEVWMEEGIFYPSGALKELRRKGLECLEKEICRKSFRVYQKGKRQRKEITAVAQKSGEVDGNTLSSRRRSGFGGRQDNGVSILVSTAEQYEAAVNMFHNKILRKNFADIYLDLQYFKKEDIIDYVNRNQDIHHFLVLPPVLREESMPESVSLLQMMLTDEVSFFGVVVRNLDELALLKWMGYQGFLVTDYSLYAMNRWAVRWLTNQYDTITVTLPVELNERELLTVSEEICHAQWVTYGHQQLMISAQCVLNTIRGCDKSHGALLLKDRYNKTFFVKCICKYCYNLIYNGLPAVLFDVGADALKERVTQRLHFTVESGKQTEQVIDTFLSEGLYKGEKTRGHYKRGVE